MKVIVRKFKDSLYMFIESPVYLVDLVFGDHIESSKSSVDPGTVYFHSSYLDKLKVVCEKHNFELEIIETEYCSELGKDEN